MFDFSWSEIALIVVVAIVFIGPKDLPAALKSISRGMRALRRMAAEFQGHIDDMVHEADLSETHDQLKKLKHFDLRERLIRAVDPDRKFEQRLTLDPPFSLSSPLLSSRGLSSAAVSEREDSRQSLKDGPGQGDEALEALLKAPPVLPPKVARRLIAQERRWSARPAILPPHCVMHDQHRVVLSCAPLKEPSGTKPPS